MPVLQRPPLAGRAAVPVPPICLLDIQVLRIAAERGKAPSNVAVVPGGDKREAGHGDARDVERPGAELGLVPKVGNAVAQVHVVGEQGLAGGGVRAADGPLIGAGAAAGAGAWIQREQGIARQDRRCGSDLRRVKRNQRDLLGVADRGRGGHGRVVAPGPDGVQVGGKRAEARAVEPGGQLFAPQLAGPVVVEHLGHGQRD